ncbi:dynactin subunit 3-like [Oryzias latipes]|uniref:dynactin subunit 3-like n=1 Tax=Oryzias latipes TaxID=8090 RepID=UPI0009DA779F|nr:dynactin subunit 3-like [Oryzias latipes]
MEVNINMFIFHCLFWCFTDVPEHATKLHRLSQIHIKEQDQTEAQSQEVKKLFEEYNKMMFLLSKQFTQWDESLRTMEEAKGIRPVE